MRYRTSKCPYCGFILENNVNTVKDNIGPPELPCPSCKNLYRTGAKYWADFTSSEKRKYWIKLIFSGTYTGIMYAIGVTIVIILIDEIIFHSDIFNTHLTILGYLFIISLIATILLVIRRQIGLMSYTKNDFDNDYRNQ